MRILIVEDYVKLAALMRRTLRRQGVLADVAIRGEDALWMAASRYYDVISLDVALPGIDGFETCRRLRRDGVQTPIIMLTASGSVTDRVEGLDAGADDYVAKPFDPAELLARLRALSRRAARQRPPVLRVGDLVLDVAACRVRRGDRELSLSATERKLLEVLMAHAGKVLSRSALVDHVWENAVSPRSNIVEVYIRYLREKIDRPFGLHTIETVRGHGYCLNA